MTFDPTITLGQVLSFSATLGAGFLIIVGFHWRLKMVEVQLGRMADVLTNLARQEERLKNIDNDLHDLKHGRGFIFDQGLKGGLPS